MTRKFSIWIMIGCLFQLGGWTGCSSEDSEETVEDVGTSGAAIPLEITCDDEAATIYGDPAILPENKGEIIACTTDSPMSRDALQSPVGANGYLGTTLTSGAEVYRVLYRTERGNGEPGYSSAIVYVPDTPRAEQLPVIVASHGSRGQAPNCAPSLFHADGDHVRIDFERQVFPLVGAGYAVIAPDLAGYANYGAEGNPPSGYASAADVSKSTLDGVKALRNLLGPYLTDDVIVTGHSQGGHTALSTLALAESYGVEGTLAGVVVYAPLWLSQRSWGAIFLLADSYPIAESPVTSAVTVWYHYTHGELLDGAGHGLEVFREDKRDGIKEFVDTSCWASGYPILESLGILLTDLFDPSYTEAIQIPAALGTECGDSELCNTWMDRFAEDRPHIEDSAADVPLLFVYGLEDTTLPPDRMSCAVERLHKDAANVEYCVNETAGHGDVLDIKADYVSQWIGSITLGETEPAPCDLGEAAFFDDQGELLVPCATPPPND